MTIYLSIYLSICQTVGVLLVDPLKSLLVFHPPVLQCLSMLPSVSKEAKSKASAPTEILSAQESVLPPPLLPLFFCFSRYLCFVSTDRGVGLLFFLLQLWL